MDIKGLTPKGPDRAGTTGVREGPTTQDAAPKATPGSDKVTLTDVASQLAALEKRAAMAPVMDDAKVARIRAMIERGDWSVDANRLAGKMMNFEASLTEAVGKKS